jgi:hypothetical protein
MPAISLAPRPRAAAGNRAGNAGGLAVEPRALFCVDEVLPPPFVLSAKAWVLRSASEPPAFHARTRFGASAAHTFAPACQFARPPVRIRPVSWPSGTFLHPGFRHVGLLAGLSPAGMTAQPRCTIPFVCLVGLRFRIFVDGRPTDSPPATPGIGKLLLPPRGRGNAEEPELAREGLRERLLRRRPARADPHQQLVVLHMSLRTGWGNTPAHSRSARSALASTDASG